MKHIQFSADRIRGGGIIGTCVSLLLSLTLIMQLGCVALAEDTGISLNDHISVDLVNRTEGYSAVLYDNTNGLPTAEANAIAETGDGFIWIGSYAGLIRYDGHTFERIDSTTGIASVVCLFVDSWDRLWVGTNDSGVAVMEQGQFRMWRKADGLRSDSIRVITEDERGNIYVATTDGIYTIDREMTLHSLDDARIVNAYMRDLRLGPGNVLYGLKQDGTVFTLRDGQIETYLDSDEVRVHGIIGLLPDAARPGYVYAGTESSRRHRELSGILRQPGEQFQRHGHYGHRAAVLCGTL